jgi:hypothetical protein
VSEVTWLGLDVRKVLCVFTVFRANGDFEETIFSVLCRPGLLFSVSLSLSLPFCDLFLLLHILTCVVGSHSFGYMSSFHYLAPRILESKAYLHVSLKTCTRICDAERHTRGLGGDVCVEEAGLISQKRDEEYKRIPTYITIVQYLRTQT